MEQRILYEIGRIEGGLGEYGQKFLVTLDESGGDRLLTYHAHEILFEGDHKESPKFPEIAEKFSLDNIVGGGHLDFCPDDPSVISFCGISSAFGGVPHNILHRFKPLLLDTYQGMDSRIMRFNNYCHDDYLKEVWKSFGYTSNDDSLIA